MKKHVLKDMAAIFVILFLLPYVITIFAFGVPKSTKIRQSKDEKTVCIAYENREETVTLTQYLVGALAAQIPIDYSLEAIKAQAVLARTYYALHEMEQEVIRIDDGGQAFLSNEQMQNLWGDSYEENYKKLEQAVTDTGNECLYYNEQLVEPYFHAVSAGSTRDGEQVFEDSAFSYLKSCSCEKDMEASGYVTIKTYTEEELCEILTQFQQNTTVSEESAQAEVSLDNPAAAFQILNRDSAGYVTRISVAGETFHGEAFRSKFSLPSANFQIEEWETGVRFVCKGLGHGLGMSLYTANALASEGETYTEILQYFFDSVTLKDVF